MKLARNNEIPRQFDGPSLVGKLIDQAMISLEK